MSSEKFDILPPLTVETLVNGGAGLARFAGMVIFIPGTVAGDRVICRLTRKKKHFAEAELLEVLEEGAGRREPPCPVAFQCGGCQWQHLEYEKQRAWKERLFCETLTRQCGVERDRILPLSAAAEQWFYRSRVQLKCQHTKDGFISGFFRPRSHFVVGVERCHISAEPLNRLMLQMRHLFNGTPFSHQVSQIDLAVDDFEKTAVTVHFKGGNRDKIIEFLRNADLEGDLLICSGKEKPVPIRGNGLLKIEVAGQVQLQYRVGSFAQVNLDQNRKLVEAVLDLAAPRQGDRIIDLYCGMGNFSLPLARRGAVVTGIEGVTESIERAKANAELNSISTVQFLCGRAEREYVSIAGRNDVDLLVLDPPRSGAAEVVQSILEKPVPRILYVSCDPQTLARDLKFLLNSSYRMISSQPFDLFPQTFHCESVTLLERFQ